jgi:hypothetical protein
MKILTLILLIIIVIMLYIGLVYYFTPKTTITKRIYLANGVPDVPLSDLPSIGAAKYSYEFWIYVNHSFPRGDLVFRIADNKTFEKSNIQFITMGNSARLTVGETNIEITDKFPLQRWQYVIINVDNNLVEIYLDGKLFRSIKTPISIPTPNANSQLMFGTGDIYLSSFNRNLFTIDQTTAFKNYMNGNNGLRLTNYGVSFDLLKNSDVAYNYPLL